LLAALVCVTSLIFSANDIVLIVLWTLASLENPAYIPVVMNFTIFFFNDMYGFISWRRREILMDL
jgi:nicotinamide mononucleotide transporter